MKKKFRIFLLMVLAILCSSCIAGCSLLGINIGGGGSQAPTFESMTVYSEFGNASDTFAYAEQYENAYVTIQLDNPDNLAVTSVTISGKKYEAASFESGSTREKIKIRINVYNSVGVVAYTLESIEYADGRVLKYVTPTIDNVVYVGVYIENQVSTFVIENVGFTDITLDVNVMDDSGLIAFSNGNVKVELYCEGELVESKRLDVGDNTVTFDGLKMGGYYNYRVLGYYDDLKGGYGENVLYANICATKVAVAFVGVAETYDGVKFGLSWHEDAEDYSIKELHIFEGDKDTKLDDTAITTVSGLLSGRDYTLVIYYDLGGSTEQIRLDFHTLTKHMPTMKVTNLWVTEDLIRTDLNIVDNDHTGSLEVKLDGQRVTVGNQKQISFNNLTYGQTYEIEITYNYDLNDGEGEHSLSESLTVTVDSQTIHQTSCKLGYVVLDDATCAVTINNKCTHEVVDIPAVVDGYTVTEIRNFSDSANLTSVLLPDTVTTIGANAFEGCKKLASIKIPQNVTAIGGNAFSGCIKLQSVTFEGNKVTSIGAGAFRGCTDLESFTIPSSVTSIGDEAFLDCEKLTSITIPASVATIGNKAFRGTKLQALIFDEDSNLTLIGDEAFYYLNQITALTLPDSVVTIGSKAFYMLDKLNTLIIPASVESIGTEAFYRCTMLKDLTFADGSKMKTIGDGAFSGCVGLTEVIIPKEVTTIGKQAFYGCVGIAGITIPNNVVTIGQQAFEKTGLSQLIFETDSSLQTIGAFAFYGTAIASVTMPSSVTTIDIQAFYNCGSLTRVNFESNSRLRTIGKLAFSKCKKLSRMILPASTVSIGENAFEACTGMSMIEFESGSKLTTIGSKAFSECVLLTGITIPASVTSIGSYAFNACGSLRTVSFDDNCKLNTIGSYAFAGCVALTAVSIPANVVTISESAFQGCVAIKKLEIFASFVTIGESAFQDCSGISTVTFEEGSGVTTIGTHAFDGCSSITELIIPASVVTIGERAFQDCSKLSTITFEEESRLTTIGKYAFIGCGPVTKLVVPASVTRIEEGAFQNFADLLSVQFEVGSRIESIGSGAFQGCTELRSIILPEGLLEIESRAFDNCKNLEWIVIPTTVKRIGGAAFYFNKPPVIYYCGSFAQWQTVTFSSSDERQRYRDKCEGVYFFVYSQGHPAWHYDDNGNPVPPVS